MVEDEIIFQTDIIIAETTERVTKELSEKIFSGIERDDSEIVKTTILGIKTKENCKE